MDVLEAVANANIILKCSGDTEIYWDYPLSIESSIKTPTIKKLPNGTYHADLNITNAHFMDTGFYYCIAKNNIHDKRELYLFVRDPEYLLATLDSISTIDQEIGKTLIIPCRPTSPSVNVTLYKNDEPMQVEYDNRKGFIIEDVSLTDNGDYACRAWRANITQIVYYQADIKHKTHSVEKPTITVEPNDGPLIVGSDVSLVCRAIQYTGIDIMLEWQPPMNMKARNIKIHESMMNSEIYKSENHREVIFKILEIKNVTTDNEGKYVCIVADHSGNNNEMEYQLKVFPIDMKYLNLSMDGNHTTIEMRHHEKNAQWIVHVAAYPAATLVWTGPNNETLSNNDKYTIRTDSRKRSKITVHDISIQDSGVYTIHASNAVKNVSLQTTLLVADEPQVSFTSTKPYYDINKEEDIECSITAYPIPDVTWYFTECNEYMPFCKFDHKKAVPMEVKPYTKNLNHVTLISRIKWYARDSGIISCKAENYLGEGNAMLDFKVTDVTNGFDIWGPKHRVLNTENIVIGCGASLYEYEPKFEWIFQFNDENQGELILNSSRKGVSITTNKTSFSYQSFLYLSDITVQNSGLYKCRISTFEKKYKEQKFKLKVQGRLNPTFTNFTSLNNSVVEIKLGRPLTWNCSVTGIPEPDVVWYKDGKILIPNGERIRLKHSNHTLHIEYTEYEDAGIYKCEASNGPGTLISAQNKLKIIHRAGINSVVLWLSFIGLVFLIVLLSVLVIALIRKYKLEHEKTKLVDLYNFSDGHVNMIDPNVNVIEQASLLPYDKKWEFPSNKLSLDKKLGSGAFGVVMKGIAMGLFEEDVPVTVAVKMVNKPADLTRIKALATELKIMAHLGQHLNVVNLLGACTGKLHKREICVIVEYCKYGNLHKYLINHRNSFINQIDPISGTVNFPEINKTTELTYIQGNTYQTNTSDYLNGKSANTVMTSLSTPVDEDGYLMNKDVMNNYQGGDYTVQTVRPISTQDLFCWGFQVAKGMEYLVSRKVLHGDLAARNVLLAEGNIVKISDFGLAKQLYSTENYCNKKRDIPLPVKWMSVEAIKDGIFSTQSDVWSYGILLWEMFSLAMTPYPGLSGPEFFNKLLNGYRMEKPKFATEDVYNLMMECWKERPKLRPTFTECAERLGGMLGETVREHYLELNSPYMKKNVDIISENDHLSKMMDPSYENVIQSGMGEGGPDSYVIMKPSKTDAMNAVELVPMIPGSKSFLNPGYQDMKNITETKYSNISQDTNQSDPEEV